MCIIPLGSVPLLFQHEPKNRVLYLSKEKKYTFTNFNSLSILHIKVRITETGTRKYIIR